MNKRDQVIKARVDSDTLDEIRKMADTDHRTISQQIDYLLHIGMRTRERQDALINGETQVDIDALRQMQGGGATR
jgi:hypothetical protein